MSKLLVLLGIALVSCTSTVSEPPKTAPTPPAPAPPTTPEPAPTTAAPTVEPVEAQWVCERDQDCAQTCLLGAVSRSWITAHPEADTCDDGCGWKSGMIACRDRECVTLTETGDIDASCTKLSPRKRG
ncbi:MAG: hypothetical protein IAG13_35030 [Deltaproteobacteria bacterium]|nr:hypothetical protein [Nannocystaceae bacterium]